MADKQLIVVVEGTAAMGPYWQTIVTDYLDKIIRSFCGNEMTGQKPSASNINLCLVMFNAHGSYSACLVQRSGWTRDVDIFFQWLSAIPFAGGGFSDAAIAEGLAEALMMFSNVNGNQSQQNMDGQKHCILVAASNPYPLPTPVYRRQFQKLEQGENIEVQTESRLSDAETVAKTFAQCSVSLSVICPKQLSKLKAIYNAGKRNPRAADVPADSIKNPHYLVLISENFVEARATLGRTGMNISSNQSPVKVDITSGPTVTGPVPTSIPSVNGAMMSRQPNSMANMPPAAVKIEPTTVTSVVSGPAFPHIPAVARPVSQGIPSMQASSPMLASHDPIPANENMQEVKPVVTGVPQPLRPANPTQANVNILNNLSQARQVVTSATLTGGTSISHQPIGGPLSNMISSGMASTVPAVQNVLSSGQSVITSVGSGTLPGNTQVAQNSVPGSFTSSSSNTSGITNVGHSQPMTNLQGGISLAQSVSGISQGNLSGGPIVQNGAVMNPNMISGVGQTSVSTGSGAMIPTPGITQQIQAASPPLNMISNTTANIQLPQQTSSSLPPVQSKYVKVWEGNLSGQRQGQPVLITRLEGYRNASASETLAANWPNTMQIVRLISQDHMNNKQYVGKADFLVFRAMNQHGFLGQLQEKKLCAVIQLPSQTLLLSVSDKACRLIGMLFPGDMVVFKPQISNQQQHHQQLQPQQHPQLQHQHQQVQQLQHLQQHLHQQQQQQQQPLQQLQQQQPQPLQQLQQQQQPQPLQQLPQQQQPPQPLQQLQQQQQSLSQMQQQQQISHMQQQQQQMSHMQQQQQQMSHMQQQQQQQQMVTAGMSQSYVQASGRPQLVSQAQVITSQGPSTMSGGGFM